MKIHTHLKYIILALFFTFSLFAQENQIFKIITPAQMDISDEGIAYLVLEVDNNDVENFTITTDSNETFKIDVNPKRTHYCKTITLHLGKNSITVTGYKEGNAVKEDKRDIFVISKVHREYKYPPKEYSYGYFHNDTNEKICAGCHDMSVNEIKGVAFVDITKSNCYQCHSSIGDKKHAHAPAVNWLCTSCHNGKVGIHNMFDANKTKFTVPDPIGNLCFSCHEKNKKSWSQKRFKHEPADSGRCNRCHNPHGSDNMYYLRQPAWDLCTTCHKDKIDGGHIVRTLSGAIHPTHGVEDPSRKSRELSRNGRTSLKKEKELSKKDKELSCVSCHNPHVSNARSLLQSNSVMSLCSRCHKK